MADPQIINGFFKIENELWDALVKIRIPGEQRQIFDAILRKTNGYNKEMDAISLNQFEEMTEMNRPAICRAINGLLSKKIIRIIKKDKRSGNVYEIIKDYTQWDLPDKRNTLSKKIIPIIKKDNPSLSKKIHTKDNTTKDNIKDNIYSRVISYLNQKTGKNFSHKTKNTKSHINARLSEGFIEQDFFTVIDNKVSKWNSDVKMREYLRPQTLFGTKFEGYLQDIPNPLEGKVSDITRRNIESFKMWEPPK